VKRTARLPALLSLAAAVCFSASAADDVVLRAMRDELQRSRALRIVNLDAPYFIEYSIDEGEALVASATLGGLVSSSRRQFRTPQVHVRVGDYKFDNTNYVGSGFPFGGRYNLEFPLETDYGVLRRLLWLATDQAYKSAVEAIARKRAAAKNINVSEQIADFARTEPVRLILEPSRARVDEEAVKDRVRKLSAIFDSYPSLRASSVELQAIRSTRNMVNSEGTEVRYPETLIYVRARAYSQAADGMLLRDASVFHALDFTRLASDLEISKGLRQLAWNVSALAQAPYADPYLGPVLFEGQAAAQLFAEVLGKNLALIRRPVMEPGRSGYFPVSDLEGRQNTRILPEWMDVVDDPTQQEWRGQPLLGHYQVDEEGVIPKPLALVEKGVLVNFLLTRQPVKGFEGSNGRARLPGNFGARTAGFGNMFVRATQNSTLSELRKRMIEMVQARSKPYGLIVRKMDFPSSASFDEVRRLLAGAQSAGGQGVSMPVLAYRLYPDGREELVRGLRFRGLSARSLKDILAASDESCVFEFLDNPAPFALMGAGGYVSANAVVAPSVLIDDLELRKSDEELPKTPIVPAP
jgi:PmbA/TldA metallopeptidase C-terminal domain